MTDQLSLLGAYAYTDTEVLKDTEGTQGNRLTNAARHTASLYLAHDLTTAPGLGNWRTGGGVRYVGEREGDADNSFQLDAYTVADAFIGWDTPGWATICTCSSTPKTCSIPLTTPLAAAVHV